MRATPVTVAAVNDFELVVQGLASMLRRHSERVEVRDAILVGEPLRRRVDVAMFDLFARGRDAAAAVRTLSSMPMVGSVVLFSIEFDRRLVADALEAGAAGFISKGLGADEIVDAIERVASGERVEATARRASPNPALLWPGKDLGLTARESEVLALVADGLTNPQIATRLCLSLETVKSHLRSVYAKLDFRNRVEASRFVAAHDDYRDTGVEIAHPAMLSAAAGAPGG